MENFEIFLVYVLCAKIYGLTESLKLLSRYFHTVVIPGFSVCFFFALSIDSRSSKKKTCLKIEICSIFVRRRSWRIFNDAKKEL